MKRILLPIILSACFLASCGSSSSASSQETTSIQETSIITSSEETSVIESSSSEEESSFITVEFDEDEDYVSDGIAENFGDISVGRPMILDLFYNYSFSYTDGTSTTGSTIEVTDNGVCVLDRVSDGGSFRLHGVKEGEAILRVYGADGYLHYRNKITFRKALDEKEILDFCFEEVDHFESQFYSKERGYGAEITFVSPTSLIYSGYDETVKLDYPIDFTIEYSYSDNTWHYYNVIEWNNKNQGGIQVLNLVTIAIDQTGYWIHAYTRSSFVDWFTPVF